MDLLFLGTSAGVPTKARNVSATAVIEASGSHWYLVDCGEGTQHRLLHTPLSIRDLRAIFITHVHGDHCFGLPGPAGQRGHEQAHPAAGSDPARRTARIGYARAWLPATPSCRSSYACCPWKR
jgi:ribonuclease BN (tRNA processing enzyme)